MTEGLLISLILAYLLFLFYLAYRAENRYRKRAKRSPLVYVLSLAVYCSAWTYYGSVGVASTSGLSFLTVYLGPIIAIPLWIVILRKVISISKVNNISSIADFISLRYGNSRSLGLIITLLCTIAIIPYISLQLKAVSESFSILTDNHGSSILFNDSAFYISLILALFTSFYGTNSSDATDNRTGILSTVAFESALKLIVFLIIGLYVTYIMYDGTADVYSQVSNKFDVSSHFSVNSVEGGMNWTIMILLSFFMVFLLPRQFQVTVVEYSHKVQMKHAIWAFPLYLFLFNVFVIFIAWAGKLHFSPSVNPDYYSIMLPLSQGNIFVATLVFFGGLSAAISMIVLSTLALSTMISNNVILPYGVMNILKVSNLEKNNKLIKRIRRISIFTLIIVSYFLFINIKNDQSLFSIGLISFVIMAQLAPSFFIGLYWNRGSSIGAKTGIVAGFVLTCFIYIIPFLASSMFNNHTLIEQGYFGSELLRPDNLFGYSDMTPISAAFFWSMFVNIALYLILSVGLSGNYRERNYGEIYTNSTSTDYLQESAFIWEGEAYIDNIKEILVRFLGKDRAESEISKFKWKYNIPEKEKYADSRFINYSEKLLSGIIGNVSAKTLISNVVQEKPVSLKEVLNVLEENKQALATNKTLTQKSEELQLLTHQLIDANEKLQELDKKKDTFLNTVAHELKTPITSIRVSSDVLMDEGMPKEMRIIFLNNIHADIDRLTVLISNILDLEKLSSGREKLDITDENIDKTLKGAMEGIELIAKKQGVRVQQSIQEDLYFPHDRNKFYQVFTNILSNALKFMPSSNGIIFISAKEIDDKILIDIVDNGRGINKADLPYVFDKFYQSDNQDVIKPQGSGFGLAIAKAIVEMHKGEIIALNMPQGGAKFTISLDKPEL